MADTRLIWAALAALVVTSCGRQRSLAAQMPQSGDGQERVLLLQKSGTPSDTSFARLLTPFPVLTAFTVCYRIRMHRFREESTLLSYATSASKDNEIRMDHRQSGYKAAVQSIWAKTNIGTPLMYWSHYCFSFDNKDSSWIIYRDGERQANGKLAPHDGALAPNGSFIIGQDQDNFGGGFERDQSYSGEITQLNFWKEQLNDSTVLSLASCQFLTEGSALAWSNMSWNISGEVDWVLRSRAEMCSTNKRTIIYFPSRLQLKNARKLCQVVGGNISVPINTEENDRLYAMSSGRAGHCSGYLGTNYLWLGAHDDAVEGRWDNWESGQPITFQGSWRGGGPNGGTVENCLVMLYGDFSGLWSDIACLDTYSMCVACEFKEYKTMYLKGGLLCETSPFNTEYLLYKDINERPSLTGYLHSDIYWNNDTVSWVLASLKDTKAMAVFVPPRPDMYPFGKKIWKVQTEACGFNPGDLVHLTLSACGESQFTCDDGSCIVLDKKCNLRVDCPDQSDEEGCTLLDIQPGYSVTIPPPPLHQNEPLEVNISVAIISFPVIKTQDLVYETNLKLTLSWQDIRLNFLDLKNERSLNLLSKVDVTKIWTPVVFFRNANGNIFTNLNPGSRVECIKNGNPVAGGPELSDEVNIFSGRESGLEMSQLYSAVYSCDFNLLMFPFDAQDCYMIFTLTSAASSYMVLRPGIIEYIGNKELIEYTIGDIIEIDYGLEEGFSQVRIGVRFQRRSGFYLLTLYIPTVLLVIIAYSSLFFNPIDFNSRISVALTSLLVLSSLFTQTSNSLPKTSYFKLVDIWLFFSIVIIFVVVLFQTLVEYYSFEPLINQSIDDGVQPMKIRPVTNVDAVMERLRSASMLKSSNGKTPFNIKVLIAGRIITPLIFLIFNIVYWAAALKYVLALKKRNRTGI